MMRFCIVHFRKPLVTAAKTPPLPEGVPPQFSYPWLMQTSDGEFHLLYTWHRLGIKHVQFNQAWLARMLSGDPPEGRAP